ncbi:hypothetical protein POTOM_035458 [Populus tomentosa]|uniref:non-specific serine/threonine protein kinase n=1 Tax=Populus tomentosa TaxID=118781 RepID=A0A8X7Z8S6_POPTO|nr:hypothetical protein POTOM_035458 [Populus tomentosa]
MESRRSFRLCRVVFLVLALMEISTATLSPAGISYEVVALVAIKTALRDPYNVLDNWDINSVDPCSWRMVTCSPDGYVSALDLSFNNLSGSLPKISARTFKVTGNPLICGPKANDNCSAVFPELLSLPSKGQLGSRTNSHRVAIAFGASFGAAFSIIIIIGLLVWWRCRHNQQIFFDVNEQYDPEVCLGHLRRYTFKELRSATDHFSSKNILGRGGFGIVYKGCLNDGTLVVVKRLKDFNTAGGEIQFQIEVETISLAIHRNLLRLSGFCTTENERLLVYPYMPNGSVASQLRASLCIKNVLKEKGHSHHFHATTFVTILETLTSYAYLISGHYQSNTMDAQELLSISPHLTVLANRNFPVIRYDHIHGRATLDWARRNRIALGIARGLLYLHEQCDPKIIHRDVKAANILLDEDFEAVVGDFGLAKLLDHRDSHVTTTVRGTVGHIAPEYLSTGQKALDFERAVNQKGVMLDWVKKLHHERKLNLMVDKDLRGNFDRIELEEMVQVALLCTQFNPSHRPKMSEVLKMLEGDGLAEKWEASQRVETPRFRSCENPPQRYLDYIEESSLVVEAMELSGPQ